MKPLAPASARPWPGRDRAGDAALFWILAADFVGALASALVHLTMIWWVLSQDVSDQVIGLMVLAIFLPLNLGVLISGIAVGRFGSRRLLVFSKGVAVGGVLACWALLAAGWMTLPLLACVAAVTYAAMGPSVAADIARVPALTRLAGRRIAAFHAANGIVMVLGQVSGLLLAGWLAERTSPATAVAFGSGLVAISAAITWATFPRDRIRPEPSATILRKFKDLSAGVLSHLKGSDVTLYAVLIAAAIVAVAEGVTEVVLPLSFRALNLPPGALATAYSVGVLGSILGAVGAQAVHGSVRLDSALAAIAVATTILLGLSMIIDLQFGVMLGVGVTSAAAWAAGTLTVASLQDKMPVSLQAQAVSLWQTLILATGALSIFVTGQIGPIGFAVLFTVSVLTTVAAVGQMRKT